MVNVIEKFSISPGSLKGLGSELTFEFVRHFIICVGENKIVLFDPRIGLDDQMINFYGIKGISFNYLMEIQGKP